MPPEPIRYFHRAKRTVETEQVYGEEWLRWTYGTTLGRFALNALVKRAVASRYYGWRMSLRDSANRILPFIVDYDLNVDEFAKKPLTFKTFNEFFYRALKPGARPVAEGERVAVLPADGRHLAFQNVDAAAGFYAKGQQFDLKAFLGDEALAAKFSGGAMLISRLCPVDYHRFHFPVAGMPSEPRLINGWLYSVSPIALRQNLAYLWQNKRMVTLVESPEFGTVAVCEIGATMVGSIFQSFVLGRAVTKGEEKGLFKFGGSCVVTLFPPGKIRLDADLVQQSAAGLEVYARMGERLGEAV
ncbi:Phosphatidylserine decarboxylase proenzyme [Lacunisphaera limnophila]|uniref:Phosphatidylserine decarboxylase proenzyme n=1 Tax=Lacunisphaera limnophila TaxID=1838286 RepID=A0A1D8AV72_9BACT|nr:phosphatidylserine decarboxylase [Lacunisphaera limnophila]AOS44783.1 Phosphatidylserine decarboxylase proenzyme [Lacunisphaera limnophila]